MTQKKLILDHSKEFFVGIAVKLPFWVSLESGKYAMQDGATDYFEIEDDGCCLICEDG